MTWELKMHHLRSQPIAYGVYFCVYASVPLLISERSAWFHRWDPKTVESIFRLIDYSVAVVTTSEHEKQSSRESGQYSATTGAAFDAND